MALYRGGISLAALWLLICRDFEDVHYAGGWSLKDPLKRRWMEKNWSFAVNIAQPLIRRRNEERKSETL